MPAAVIAASLLTGSTNTWFTGSQALVLVAVVGITVLMLISARRKIRESRNTPRTYARDLYARLKEEKAAVSDVQEVMLELEQLARQIHGQIDTKFAKLETVIRDADQRIETLSRMVRKADGDQTIDVTIDDRSRPAEVEAPPIEDGRSQHAEVYRLADAAMGPVQIAQETGKTVGEVELILALRKTRNQASPQPEPTPQ